VITEDRVQVNIELVLFLDADDVPEEHQDEEGLRSIIEEVINAGIYDVPGAEIHNIKMDIKGIE
jgi:hypothetical protein